MGILLAMIFIMPFEINPYLKIADSFLGVIPEFTMIKLLGMIGLGWSALQLMQGRMDLAGLASPQVRVFFLFVATVVFASIAGGAGRLVVSRLLSVIFFLPLILAVVRTEADLRRALQAGTAIMILVFPYAYRQTLRFGGRLGVGLYEANYFALELVMWLPLAYVFARQEKSPWKRRFWFVGFGVIVLEIIMTGSRGGFLGLVVVGMALIIKLVQRRVLALVAVGVALVPILLSTGLGHRIRASGLDSDAVDVAAEQSLESRKQILLIGLEMIAANPILGVGFGNFRANTEAKLLVPKIAHNTYLEIAAELGLPAFAVYIGLLWVIFAALRRTGRTAAAMGRTDLAELAVAIRIGLLGFCVSQFFLSAQFEKFFWLMVFLTICLERVVTELARSAKSIAQSAQNVGQGANSVAQRA